MIVATSLWALSRPKKPVAEWYNVMLGSWTFLAPWLLNFSSSGAHAWNAWIVGGLVTVLSLWTLSGQTNEAQKVTNG